MANPDRLYQFVQDHSLENEDDDGTNLSSANSLTPDRLKRFRIDNGFEDAPKEPSLFDDVIDSTKNIAGEIGNGLKNAASSITSGVSNAASKAVNYYSENLAPENSILNKSDDELSSLAKYPLDFAKITGAGIGKGLLKLSDYGGAGPLGLIAKETGLSQKAQDYLQSLNDEATKDLSKSGINVDEPLLKLNPPHQDYIKPPKTFAEKITRGIEGVGEGVGELAEGLTTPRNIAYLAGGGIGKIPATATALSFIPDLAQGALTEASQVPDQIMAGDYKGAGRSAIKSIGSAGFGYGIGKGLLRGARGTARPVENAPEVVKETVIPEAPQTIKAQIESLKQNRAKAVLLTDGESLPEIPKRFAVKETNVGKFVFDPLKILPSTVERKVADGSYGELLGHVEPKSFKTTETVAALDNKGQELKTSLVSRENVPQQAQILKEQFPQAEIKTGGEDLAQEVLQKRQQQKFQSEDGLIEDLLNRYGNEIGSVGNLTKESKKGFLRNLKNERGSLRVDQSSPFVDTEKIPDNKPQERLLAQEYVKSLVEKQNQARQSEQPTLKSKASNFYKELKTKLVDSNAPIEDAIAAAQKKHQFELLPKHDITNQIDRVYRAPTLAGQFIEDGGLVKVIKEIDNLDNFDQYLIARHAKTLAEKGVETGRDLAKDQWLVENFRNQYEPYAKQVTDYSRKLLDYSVDSGLISKDLATKLKEIYPDYVPMQRIFSELEKKTGNYGTKAVASRASQSVVQKLEGSKREVESPIASLLTKTYDAFRQGEQNKTARILAGYKDLPGMSDLIYELKTGENHPNTFSYLDNGKKKTFATTPEIEAAAKALDVQQLNILGKILQAPTRIAKMGITGLNLPFVLSNVVRDQLTAFVNSKNGIKTSIANPSVFTEALFEAVKHGDLYKEMVRQGAAGTSFDILRNEPHKTVERIRADRNLSSKIKYVAHNPSELLRIAENIIGRSEEVTRLQQFGGTKRSLLKKGRTIEDANILSAKASRENTANFARAGEWGRVLNGAFLYLNAGIQGSRSFVRSLERSPAKTISKVAIGTMLPMAMLTAWNLSDPKRREAYKDIEDYEKENNLILIPPNPTQDDKGAWNVIKIPLPPNLGSLSIPVRKALEVAQGVDEAKFMDIANALIGTVSPIELSGKSILNTLTPQAIKPSLEASTNVDSFTGKPIVPQFLKNKPPEKQVYDWTSGTARKIGKALDASPIKVEKFIKSTFGGLGSQALNLSDRILTPNQVGGQDPIEASLARFTKARGGRKKRLMKEKKANRQ